MVDTSITKATALKPPFRQQPISDDTGQWSQNWNQYLTDMADRLTLLTQRFGQGVTDGSEASPGDVGEVMTASGSATSLANNTPANLATLNLTAGDWDVSGNVAFSASAGTHISFGCGIGGMDTLTQASYPTSAVVEQMTTAVRRYNVSATTAVSVVGQAGFTGTCTASGTIRARRMR